MPFFHRSLPDSVALPPWWVRHHARWLVAALLCTVVVCDRLHVQPTRNGGDTSRYHKQSFRVERVIDGDTFDIAVPDRDKSTTRIRLWGVDTPEVARGNKTGMYFGKEASHFAKESLTNRDVYVVLVGERTRGKFGRLLAYIYLEQDGPMFNEMLVEQGFAYADMRFDHPYFDRFKKIETIARKNKKGLWKSVTTEQMPSWRQRYERGDFTPPKALKTGRGGE